ncbi:MAG: baseplate J/gp47 family protein [Rhodospirillales bacterium]|nr:baseplate J/gp47 family protein [Rhodospirillales bacterium]
MNNLRVTAEVLAALSHMHLNYLDWIARQVIPDTAEGDYLERWGNIFGVRRKPASPATGVASFTGTPGAIIGTGTVVQSGDGQQYRTTEGGTIAAGPMGLHVEAAIPGRAGIQDGGVALRLVSAQPGVAGVATVSAPGLTGGADIEGDEDMLSRLLLRIQTPPHGGNQTDYVEWALQVPGVTRAWAYPGEMGLGTVTVRFMMDIVNAAQNGVPQGSGDPGYSGDLLAVFNHLSVLRPVTARLFVAAPVPRPLAISIAGLTPNTPEVRAQVEAELRDMLRRDAAPGDPIYRSRIWEAVSVAAGESHHAIQIPDTDVFPEIGEIITLGSVTYL